MKFDREELLKIGKVKGRTILDIGTGPLAGIAAGDFNCIVTSIDISENSLRQAETELPEELRGKIRFEKGDATALSYPDNSFDIVVSYGALHHVDKTKRVDFIKETYRVARQRVIIAEYSPAYFEEIHSNDPYEVVDFLWLEKELRKLGEVEKYPGKEMSIFILNKRI
jgi:ubiquinone/menaquinone biosynthesis C-methylase UbiE